MSFFLKSFGSSSAQRNSDNLKNYNSNPVAKITRQGSKNFIKSKDGMSDLISSNIKKNLQGAESRNHGDIQPYGDAISFIKRPGSFNNNNSKNEIEKLREENEGLRKTIQEMHEEKMQLKNNLKINKEVI